MGKYVKYNISFTDKPHYTFFSSEEEFQKTLELCNHLDEQLERELMFGEKIRESDFVSRIEMLTKEAVQEKYGHIFKNNGIQP